MVARSPYPGSTSADTAWSWGNSSLDNWLLVSSGTPRMFSWGVIFFIADKICPQLRPGFLIEMVDSLVTVPHSAKGRGLIDWFLKKKLHSGSVTQVWVLREPWCGQPLLSSVHTVLRTWIDWFLQKFVYTWWMLDLYPRCGFCVMCWELDWLISPKVWLHMMNVGSLPQVWVLRDVLRTWIDRFLHKICLNMINVDMCYRCGFCVSHEVDSHYCPHYA